MNKSPESSPQQGTVISHESVEDGVETGELFRAEYVEALERFMLIRANEEDPDLPDDKVREVGFASMEANYNLLEDIGGFEDINDSTESICTVTIPIAIMSEDIDSVLMVVEKLGRSHQDNDGPLDVILWANAKYSAERQSDVRTKASARYDELVGKLQSLDAKQLRIKTALQLIPEKDFSMSKMRSNYMDAVALDSLNRGYGFNHPVMWIDADMTHIAKGAIKELTNPLRNIESLITHADLQFTADWAPEEPFSDLDDHTRAFIFHEAQRRRLNWIQSSSDTSIYSKGSYPEECGLAFTTGVYLLAGGVDKKVPYSESSHLARNIRRSFIKGFPETIEEYGWEKNKELPMRDIDYRRAARIGVSARRHYEVAKRNGVSALPDTDSAGYEMLFTDMDKSIQVSDDVNSAEVESLFEANNEAWLKRLPSFKKPEGEWEKKISNSSEVERKQDRNAKVAKKVINRYFKA